MKEKQSEDLRNIVLTMLTETLEEGKLSHIVVNSVFKRENFEAQERGFVSRLYLGVLERLISIDFFINRFSKTNTQKMKPVILNILRLSVYQIVFMDAVPDFAAVSEAVRLTEKRGFKGLKPFVNGVLRAVVKNRESFYEGMSENVRLSVPKWIYEMAAENAGKEKAEEFFENALAEKSGVAIRLNLLKGTETEIIEILEKEGLKPEKIDGEFSCFKISGFKSLNGLKSYQDGLFTVQDVSSVKAGFAGAQELEAKEKPFVIDVCAAPGGKVMCAAERFPDSEILAFDVSEEKVSLISENLKRMGIRNVKAAVGNALEFNRELFDKADLLIADVPCSGLGVISGKPDIKFRVRKKDIKELAAVQQDILRNASKYVKPGGILSYSTCTFSREENEDNIELFLKEHEQFELKYQKRLFENGDGFFIAVMHKVR